MNVRSIALLATLGVLLFSRVAFAQENWSRITTSTSPSARYAPAVTFNTSLGHTVLFGGEDGIGNRQQDTWTYNGTNWSQVATTTQPSARTYATICYDISHTETVLFGGLTGSGRSNETWTFNGSNWTQEAPSTSPSARSGHATVYEASNSSVLLFGGIDSGANFSNETWRWDGSNWTQLAPATSPQARYHHAMAYDANRGVVVLFGGYDNGIPFSDTWEWNGVTWTQKSPAHSPNGLHHHSMVYDTIQGKVVLFGGLDSSITDQTWMWDGNDWSQRLPATNPGPREAFGLGYDTARHKTVLFGGDNSSAPFIYDETWEFDSGPPPTATATATSTSTSTATATATATRTSTPTTTATATATPTLVTTATPTPTPAQTFPPTVEPTAIATPTQTPSDCFLSTQLVNTSPLKTITVQVKIAEQLTKASLANLSRLLAILRDPGCFAPLEAQANNEEGGTIVAISSPDETGTFRFTVPEGTYSLTFSGPQIVLEPKTIEISTDAPNITRDFRSTPVDLHDEGCQQKDEFAAITTVTKAAEAQALYGLKLYSKYSKSLSKQKNSSKALASVEKLAVEIQRAREQVLSAGISLPALQLSCNGKTSCTTVKFGSQVKLLTSGLKALQKNTTALASKANSYLKNIPLSIISTKAGQLYQKALKKKGALPNRTDVCSG